MDSVYRSNSTAGVARSGNDSFAVDWRAQLEGVEQLGRNWLARCDEADPQRGDLIHMDLLVKDLIGAGDHPVAAMTTTRALLCANCRRLNAAEGKCLGQALERCMLLSGVNS